jgi:hypothetical protein
LSTASQPRFRESVPWSDRNGRPGKNFWGQTGRSSPRRISSPTVPAFSSFNVFRCAAETQRLLERWGGALDVSGRTVQRFPDRLVLRRGVRLISESRTDSQICIQAQRTFRLLGYLAVWPIRVSARDRPADSGPRIGCVRAPPPERSQLRRPPPPDGPRPPRERRRAPRAAAEVPASPRGRVPGHRSDPGRDRLLARGRRRDLACRDGRRAPGLADGAAADTNLGGTPNGIAFSPDGKGCICPPPAAR